MLIQSYGQRRPWGELAFGGGHIDLSSNSSPSPGQPRDLGRASLSRSLPERWRQGALGRRDSPSGSAGRSSLTRRRGLAHSAGSTSFGPSSPGLLAILPRGSPAVLVTSRVHGADACSTNLSALLARRWHQSRLCGSGRPQQDRRGDAGADLLPQGPLPAPSRTEPFALPQALAKKLHLLFKISRLFKLRTPE